MINDAAGAVASAMLALVGLGVIGVVVRRAGVLDSSGVSGLNRLIIDVTLPCLALTNVLSTFQRADVASYWPLPLAGVGYVVVGQGVGWMLCRLLGVPVGRRGTFINLVGVGNATYLPVPLLTVVFAGQTREEAFLYLFLFLLGYGPAIWTTGVLAFQRVARSQDRPFSKTPFSVTFVAIVLGILLAVTGTGVFIPSIVTNNLKMLGDVTVPLAMVSVGATTAGLSTGRGIAWRELAGISVGKLVLLPLAAWGLTIVIGAPLALTGVLLIEGATPPATSLVILAERYGGDVELTGQAIVATYLLAILVLPVWLLVVF